MSKAAYLYLFKIKIRGLKAANQSIGVNEKFYSQLKDTKTIRFAGLKIKRMSEPFGQSKKRKQGAIPHVPNLAIKQNKRAVV